MGFIANPILGIGQGQGADFKAQGATQQQANGANDNVQQGLGYQQALLGQMGYGGIQNQKDVFAQQQQLAGQLSAQAQGQGPNPAQAQFATNQGNIAGQQAALMAGQRGAGANAGMIARQAGMQGMQGQQQAAGQAATLQAQQQLAAQQALMQQQAGMQQVAGQQVGQLQTGFNAYNQTALGQQGNLLSSVSEQNKANAGVAGVNANNSGKLIGGVLNGASAALGMAHGGQVPNGPQSRVGQHFHAMKAGGRVPGKAQVAGDSPKNDTVAAKLSPGEIVIPRSHANDPEKAAAFARAVAMKNQGKK